ncbi:hypothetical protein WICPIJ_002639 [Wickerhamomyces pijperi]|uniref:Biogenesis of lysosome-related organelles complex 1 subunit KXD1 n=1 Tax=Wickerhamomyces pijperi TaxID=599730 RepID=A0A9P8TPG5_WICPI|nr:hypothetical protein WICPIJ_002639 [Wickerhamomyces pijperi]
MSRSRQPSINSQTYAIPNGTSPLTAGESELQFNHEEEEEGQEFSDTNSSYQESVNDQTPNNEPSHLDDFDSVTYLHDSIMTAMDVSLQWNKLLANQTHTSGVLKSKYQEVSSLLETSETELIHYKKDFESGVVMISNLMKDLNGISKKLHRLETEFSKDWMVEFQQAKDKVMGGMDLQKDIREMQQQQQQRRSKATGDSNITPTDIEGDEEIYI